MCNIGSGCMIVMGVLLAVIEAFSDAEVGRDNF